MDNSTAPTKGLLGYIAVSRRRRMSILIAFGCGIVASCLLAALLPARYRSSGTILIEQQEIPTDIGEVRRLPPLPTSGCRSSASAS